MKSIRRWANSIITEKEEETKKMEESGILGFVAVEGSFLSRKKCSFPELKKIRRVEDTQKR